MDWSREWAYFPVAVLINTLFYIFIARIYKKMQLQLWQLVFGFISSALITWGMDILLRFLEATKWIHAIKISLGAWLLFSFAPTLRQHRSWKQIKLDFKQNGVIDLLSFIIIGLIIFGLT